MLIIPHTLLKNYSILIIIEWLLKMILAKSFVTRARSAAVGVGFCIIALVRRVAGEVISGGAVSCLPSSFRLSMTGRATRVIIGAWGGGGGAADFI